MADNDSARGAGLRHAWVRTADGVYHDIDAAMSVEGESELEITEVPGDDQKLADFASKPTKSVSVKANALSPYLLAAITGISITDVMDGPTKIGEEIGMGHDGDSNPPFVEIGSYTVAKRKSDDKKITIVRTFHKCQLRLTTIPQEKDSEFNCEFEGTAYPTTKDIEGNALSYERVDTLRHVDKSVETLIAEQEAVSG